MEELYKRREFIRRNFYVSLKIASMWCRFSCSFLVDDALLQTHRVFVSDGSHSLESTELIFPISSQPNYHLIMAKGTVFPILNPHSKPSGVENVSLILKAQVKFIIASPCSVYF